MKGRTIREAAEAWVQTFNAIPQGLIQKLIQHDPDEVYEITPPGAGDHVYIYAGKHDGEYGEIVKRSPTDDDVYIIELDGSDKKIRLRKDDFEVQRDDYLPMWGWVWTFGDHIDEEWANGEYLGCHLQEMADCGFRIYEQEDLGLFFGIDGCGYDFYDAHWIPLYKARGLQWHDPEKEDEAA